MKTPRNEVWNSNIPTFPCSCHAVKTPRNEVWNSRQAFISINCMSCENTSKWGMEQHTTVCLRQTCRCENTSKWGMEQLFIALFNANSGLWKHLEMRYGTAEGAVTRYPLPAVKTPRNEVWNSLLFSLMDFALCYENTSKWGMEQQHLLKVSLQRSCENTSKWGMEQLHSGRRGHGPRCENTSKWGMEQLFSSPLRELVRCENTSKWGMEQLPKLRGYRAISLWKHLEMRYETASYYLIKEALALWKHLEMRYGTALRNAIRRQKPL